MPNNIHWRVRRESCPCARQSQRAHSPAAPRATAAAACSGLTSCQGTHCTVAVVSSTHLQLLVRLPLLLGVTFEVLATREQEAARSAVSNTSKALANKSKPWRTRVSLHALPGKQATRPARTFKNLTCASRSASASRASKRGPVPPSCPSSPAGAGAGSSLGAGGSAFLGGTCSSDELIRVSHTADRHGTGTTQDLSQVFQS